MSWSFLHLTMHRDIVDWYLRTRDTRSRVRRSVWRNRVRAGGRMGHSSHWLHMSHVSFSHQWLACGLPWTAADRHDTGLNQNWIVHLAICFTSNGQVHIAYIIRVRKLRNVFFSCIWFIVCARWGCEALLPHRGEACVRDRRTIYHYLLCHMSEVCMHTGEGARVCSRRGDTVVFYHN